jgi:hypothetical protein
VKALAFEAVLPEPPPMFDEPSGSEVVRVIAVREDQTLEQLHEALRLTFGWADAHLYAFWLDGRFWSTDESAGYWAPFELEPGRQSARVPVGELSLRKGKKIAYLFDFGDEWRLTLKLVDSWPAEGLAYPMLVGTNDVPALPQYPPLDDDEPDDG